LHTVATVSFIAFHDPNILSADQNVSDGGTFFTCLEIEGEGFGPGQDEFAGADFYRPAHKGDVKTISAIAHHLTKSSTPVLSSTKISLT
jgi:hypothetical protein